MKSWFGPLCAALVLSNAAVFLWAALGGSGDRRGSPATQRETEEERAELTEPIAAMLQRQFSGDDVAPTDVFPRAARRARAIGRYTARVAPAVAKAEWELAGPTNIGGRVLDIAVDPALPDTIYAAAASGGVWKSADAGRTFSPVWPVDLTQAIGALAITPSGVLYAGTGEAGPGGGSITYGGTGVYRSDDRGRTWRSIGLRGTSRISRIVVDPANEKRIWVAATGNLYKPGGERGLYRSDDGGKTWKLVLTGDNGTTGATDVAINPKDPKIVLAAMWDHKRGPNEHRYYGPGSGLFRSTDGGETWTRAGGPTLASSPILGRIGVAIAPSDPDVVYVIAQVQTGRYLGLYKSTDGGATFLVPTVDANIIQASASFAWWFGRVWVTPDDADDVFVAGVSLIRSRDGGITSEANSQVHADQHAMAWDPKVPGRVYLGNDGGVYRSDDGGDQYEFAEYQPWSQLYSLDVSEQDPTRLVAGLQDNGVNKMFDGDGSWAPYGGGDGERTLIKPTDMNTVYGCSQYGACFVNRNGAISSSDDEYFDERVVSARKNWFTPIEFDPEDDGVVYTGGEIMSRSTDDARTWTPISGDLSNGPQPDSDPDYRSYGSLTAIGPAGQSTGVIYAGTDDGNLWSSVDNGASWQKSSDPDLPKAWITRVQPDPRDRTGHTAYVTYSGFRAGDEPAYLLKTTDAGKSWTNITGDLPAAPLNDVNVIGESLLVIASDLGVFASIDSGAHWLRIGANLPLAPVHELRYHQGTNQLFVATFGRSMWRVAVPSSEAFAPAARRVRVTKVRRAGARLRVTLACRSATPCRGRLTVRKPAGRRPRTYARGSFAVAANRTRTVSLRLTAAGRRALRRGGRVRVVAALKGGRTSRPTLRVPKPRRG